MINIIEKQINKKIKNINKKIHGIWNYGKLLSEYFGTNVCLTLVNNGEYDIEKKVIVEVPRPCGCCKIELQEYLQLDTPNLKNIILKLREVEKKIIEVDNSYKYMYNIFIPLTIKEFEKKNLDDIVKITMS